jgi:hypothetical protein
MNRWTRILIAALACAAGAAMAQTTFTSPAPTATIPGTSLPVFTTPPPPSLVREAPRDVKPAIITVSTTPPVIAVDGVPDRFSPGARIRDRNNMLVLTGQLAGTQHYTVYRRDAAGLVHEVWLLTYDEYSKVGGISTGDPAGYLRFYELLNLVWAARYLLLSPVTP